MEVTVGKIDIGTKSYTGEFLYKSCKGIKSNFIKIVKGFEIIGYYINNHKQMEHIKRF
jgi:hypothetical protein